VTGPTAEHADEATLRRICAYFLRLGALGFGGPVALVGYMQRDLVTDRRWISEHEYRDGLAIAQMAPGPLAAQLAMWLAFVRQGIRGATLASFAFVGPPFLITVTLAAIYVAAGGATWLASLFYGIAPAAIAIIVIAAYRLLPLTVGRDPLLISVAAAVGLLTFLTRSEIALAFLTAGFVVLIVRVGAGPLLERLRSGAPAMVPLEILWPASLQLPVLADLTLFFIKAGAFVFGSGLAIVPFLHEGLVADTRWLSEQQFLDAVAVGLITPGPIVITAAFAGFLIAGLPGAFVASFGVFLPVYLFVIIPAPLFLRHKDAVPVRAFVAGVSAAAAGAIVAATGILGQQAIRDLTGVAIAVAALLALLAIRRFRPPVITRLAEPFVVACAGAIGLALRGV